jgi:uncharacterized protein (TIGR02266 family)
MADKGDEMGTTRVSEQRREERAPLAIEVSLESEHNFYSGITGNVSAGGVFVATYVPPPMGAEVELVLKLENHEPVKLRGIVCWVRGPERTTDYAPAGCGIRWIDLPPGAEKIIAGFVDKRDTIFHDDE